MEGNTARGASSPANPALTRPEPLSHTRAVVSSSSHMVGSGLWAGLVYCERRAEDNASLSVFMLCGIHPDRSR